MLTSRGLGRVLGDLAALGFNAQWGVLGAADVGAPHQRDRIWIAGWRDVFPYTELLRLGWRKQQQECAEETSDAANAINKRLEVWESQQSNNGAQLKTIERASWWNFEPNVGRVADGVAARVDRLKAIGNGQVPEVAATAWGAMK